MYDLIHHFLNLNIGFLLLLDPILFISVVVMFWVTWSWRRMWGALVR